jgi:hypothetical protein
MKRWPFVVWFLALLLTNACHSSTPRDTTELAASWGLDLKSVEALIPAIRSDAKNKFDISIDPQRKQSEWNLHFDVLSKEPYLEYGQWFLYRIPEKGGYLLAFRSAVARPTSLEVHQLVATLSFENRPKIRELKLLPVVLGLHPN